MADEVTERRREQLRAAGRRYYERHRAQEQARKGEYYRDNRAYHLAHKRRRRAGPEGDRVRALNAAVMRRYRRRMAMLERDEIAAIEREIERREGRHERKRYDTDRRLILITEDGGKTPRLAYADTVTALCYRPRWYTNLCAWHERTRHPAATVAARKEKLPPATTVRPVLGVPHYVRVVAARLKARKECEI